MCPKIGTGDETTSSTQYGVLYECWSRYYYCARTSKPVEQSVEHCCIYHWTDGGVNGRNMVTAINCLLDLAAAVWPGALWAYGYLVPGRRAAAPEQQPRCQANPPRRGTWTWASIARNKSGCSMLRVRSIRLICESATFKSLCNIHSARRYSHKQSSSGVPQFHKSNSALLLCSTGSVPLSHSHLRCYDAQK